MYCEYRTFTNSQSDSIVVSIHYQQKHGENPSNKPEMKNRENHKEEQRNDGDYWSKASKTINDQNSQGGSRGDRNVWISNQAHQCLPHCEAKEIYEMEETNSKRVCHRKQKWPLSAGGQEKFNGKWHKWQYHENQKKVPLFLELGKLRTKGHSTVKTWLAIVPRYSWALQGPQRNYQEEGHIEEIAMAISNSWRKCSRNKELAESIWRGTKKATISFSVV